MKKKGNPYRCIAFTLKYALFSAPSAYLWERFFLYLVVFYIIASKMDFSMLISTS